MDEHLARSITPESSTGLHGAALVAVDVQYGFDDATYWGPRNNPASEANIVRLVTAWQQHGWPLVYVRHDSAEPSSPLKPNTPGNALKTEIVSGEPDLLVTKNVNSSFHGTPDLNAWLRSWHIKQVVICGITTNHCCETTARVAGNLGYDTYFVIDATHTFDRASPSGARVPAQHLADITATNLHGEFATVITTNALLHTINTDRARP